MIETEHLQEISRQLQSSNIFEEVDPEKLKVVVRYPKNHNGLGDPHDILNEDQQWERKNYKVVLSQRNCSLEGRKSCISVKSRRSGYSARSKKSCYSMRSRFDSSISLVSRQKCHNEFEEELVDIISRCFNSSFNAVYNFFHCIKVESCCIIHDLKILSICDDKRALSNLTSYTVYISWFFLTTIEDFCAFVIQAAKYLMGKPLEVEEKEPSLDGCIPFNTPISTLKNWQQTILKHQVKLLKNQINIQEIVSGRGITLDRNLMQGLRDQMFVIRHQMALQERIQLLRGNNTSGKKGEIPHNETAL